MYSSTTREALEAVVDFRGTKSTHYKEPRIYRVSAERSYLEIQPRLTILTTDVVTYMASLPSVDSRRIILWGMSLGATVSACAAAIDRRVAAVLMVCPIFSFVRPDKRAKAFAQLMRDRESQLRGNEPFTLQPFNSKGENPIGYAGSGGPRGKEAYFLMSTAAERGHPNFRDRITLQSYHKMALFRPKELL